MNEEARLMLEIENQQNNNELRKCSLKEGH
jgi:hypothetical protein